VIDHAQSEPDDPFVRHGNSKAIETPAIQAGGNGGPSVDNGDNDRALLTGIDPISLEYGTPLKNREAGPPRVEHRALGLEISK
jgi:hypothetical protein